MELHYLTPIRPPVVRYDSNVVTLPDGNLAILFEGGASSPYEGIVFRELPFGRFEAGRTPAR